MKIQNLVHSSGVGLGVGISKFPGEAGAAELRTTL